jgi:cell division septum initiation protein DivIVA
MPDESSAAREHAILSEIAAPLSTLPDDALQLAADVDFPVALRGYDRLAVDAYVRKTTQLVAELQATHSPESAIRRALERVGEEISGVLQKAHETANQITAQSRSEAEDRLEVARRESIEITAEARARVNDLDVETDRIWAERQRIVEDARELARQLTTLADAALERFPPSEPEPEPESLPDPVAAEHADDEMPTAVLNGGDPADDGGPATIEWRPDDAEPGTQPE